MIRPGTINNLLNACFTSNVASDSSLQQKAMIIAAPAAVVVGSKVVMGLGAAGCAVLSKVADAAGKKELSTSLENTKNNLFARATSFGKEVNVAAGLTIVAATAAIAVTKFTSVPEPTIYERLSRLSWPYEKLLLIAEQARCHYNI